MKIFLNRKKRNLLTSEQDKAILKAQADRIDLLKQQLKELSDENRKLREREEGVSDALFIAKQKAGDYLEEAKIRFALECERLDGYRRQWTSYIKDLGTAEKLGLEVIDTEKKLRNCAREMQGIFNEDMPFLAPPYGDYMSEFDRINEELDEDDNNNLGLSETYASVEETMHLSDDDLKNLIVQLLNKGL